jgi:hypothetical protein
MKVTQGAQTYESDDGILFISDAKSGSYTVSLTGINNGSYTLSIGQFGEITNTWKEVTSPINSGQTQTYTFSFQPNTPISDPFVSRPVNDIFADLDRQINALKPSVTYKTLIPKTLLDVKRLKTAYEKKQILLAKGYMELLLTDLSILRRTSPSPKLLKDTLLIDETLIDLSARLFDEKKQPIFKPLIKILDKATANLLNQTERDIKKKKLTEGQKKYFSLLYLEAEKAYQQSKKETSGIRSFFTLSHAHILLTELP